LNQERRELQDADLGPAEVGVYIRGGSIQQRWEYSVENLVEVVIIMAPWEATMI
jgi:hypothetical protein